MGGSPGSNCEHNNLCYFIHQHNKRISGLHGFLFCPFLSQLATDFLAQHCQWPRNYWIYFNDQSYKQSNWSRIYGLLIEWYYHNSIEQHHCWIRIGWIYIIDTINKQSSWPWIYRIYKFYTAYKQCSRSRIDWLYKLDAVAKQLGRHRLSRIYKFCLALFNCEYSPRIHCKRPGISDLR